ncbi:NAD(P)/FAD-dependent oxidoreductase [Streptomyces sp. NPDC019531]|uniref:NAD(P)/FAD-dependent oxidoreductase n=1 Tax=Streptomyces sp. NPDC019531 TaxID=3365062 RepID=UPI00384E6688
MTHAVVLGGGIAGLLAASTLARHTDRVTLVEGDRFPAAPQHRKGLPQAYQNHLLMRGGTQAVDALLPGTTARLLEAGAHRRLLGQEILTLTAQGWFRRHPTDAYVIACSRDLIDHTLRAQALWTKRITVREGTRVTGLLGDPQKITGVRVAPADGGPEEQLGADLVVDASGSRSKSPQWLSALGLPDVTEEHLDAGLAYAGRWYTAPLEAAADMPAVLIQTESGSGRPGRGAALFPNEDGRWIVALMGTRGAHPPNDDEGFLEYARSLRHPVVAELLEQATPIGPIRHARALANRRRFYEKLPVPDGYVALGDVVCVLSPNYATGMSLAALGALALRTQLRTTGLVPGFSRKVQSAVAKVVAPAWQMAVTNDSGFPGVETDVTLRGTGFSHAMTRRWTRTALEHPVLADLTMRMTDLTAAPTEMMRPSLMAALLRGPRRPQLTADEAIAQFPEFGSLLKPAEGPVPAPER